MKLTLQNPLAANASLSMQRHQRTMKTAATDLNTGKKSNNNIISDLLGRKLESGSRMLRAVSKNIRYGAMVTDTASADLNAAKEVLLELKETIVAANTAGGETLDTLNTQYLQGEEELKNILSRSQVNGRSLFNHEGPLNIDIRVGENISDTSKLELPDMREQTTNLKGAAPVNDNTRHSLAAGDAWGDNGRTAAENQREAEAFIDRLITQVDGSIHTLSAKKRTLQSTNDHLLKTAALQDEAAGNYLNTDYESTIEEFKNALKGMRVSCALLSHGEAIGQLALKLLEQN